MARKSSGRACLIKCPRWKTAPSDCLQNGGGGDVVVDLAGHLVVLKPGVQVVPFGCGEADCSTTWDSESELGLPQVVISYQLKQTWFGLMANR